MKWTVDAIIFDFDGVLINSGGDIANATNYVLRTLGLMELPADMIVGYIGSGPEPLLRKCLAERADELFEQALPMFKLRYSEYFMDETFLYPEVPEVLKYFYSSGKVLNIATNKMEKITRRILQGFGVDRYFQVVVGPDSVTHRKPHPESLCKIMEQIGVNPSRTIMVGDTRPDILAGKAAGTLTCGVIYGFGTLDEVQSAEPDFIIDCAKELIDYIA